MAFGQLYYTSCRTGLAGAPGFQFNAVTAGLDQEVLREVEQLTVYQPPRSAEPADAPVNLCFRPGPVTLVARVAYVGIDYSHRPGNYFAHALVTLSPQADLGDRPAIELWGAPFWQVQPIDRTELPPLPGPPPAGTLDRARTDAFTRDRPAAKHLPAMLTAAEAAVRSGDRRVVLIGADDQENAYWIAALSYRLPSATRAAMSFATYERDPRYSRVHVVGTLRTGDLDRSERDFESFDLFDLTDDRVSDIAVHPVARMLAEIDAADAAEAWRRAGRLATGSEQSFDDWRPVVAAALMTWSVSESQSARDEQVAVAAWLAGSGAHLPDAEVAELGRAALALIPRDAADDGTTAALGDLAAVAGARRLTDLLEQIERRLLQLIVVRARAVEALPPGPIRSAAVCEQATEVLSDELTRLPETGAAALLGWAAAAGLPIRAEVQHELGVQMAGPALLHQPGDPAWRAALEKFPALRHGVAAYLATVAPEELDRLVAAFQAGLGAALGNAVPEAGPVARQAATVAEVRAGRLDPLDGLATALTDTAGLPVDRLVELLFPTGAWTPVEAGRALAVLGHQRARIEPVVARFATTVLTEPAPEARRRYAELCVQLYRSPVRTLLPPAARERVELFTAADQQAENVARSSKNDLAGVRKNLREWLLTLAARDQQTAEEVLLARFPDFKASARAELIQMLPGLRRAYCAGLAQALGRRSTELAVAAGAVRTLRHLTILRPTPVNQAAVAELDGLLRATIGRWPKRQQARLVEYVEADAAPESAAFLRQWFRQAPPGLFDRLVRRLVPGGGSAVPDPDAPQRRPLG